MDAFSGRDRKYRQNGGEMISRNSTDKDSRRVEFKGEIKFRHLHFGYGRALRLVPDRLHRFRISR